MKEEGNIQGRKHGRAVGIEGKSLSYFHSRQRSLEFKSDTSAHHFARPTFMIIPAPRHSSPVGFVWRLKARRMATEQLLYRASFSFLFFLPVTIIFGFLTFGWLNKNYFE